MALGAAGSNWNAVSRLATPALAAAGGAIGGDGHAEPVQAGLALRAGRIGENAGAVLTGAALATRSAVPSRIRNADEIHCIADFAVVTAIGTGDADTIPARAAPHARKAVVGLAGGITGAVLARLAG